MIKELIDKETGDNSWIVQELIDLIIEEKIWDLNQLQQYQDHTFSINNKVMSREKQIDRVIKILDSEFNYPIGDVIFVRNEKDYIAQGILEDLLDCNIEDDEEIMILIAKLETIMKLEPHFPYDVYKLIIEGKL